MCMCMCKSFFVSLFFISPFFIGRTQLLSHLSSVTEILSQVLGVVNAHTGVPFADRERYHKPIAPRPVRYPSKPCHAITYNMPCYHVSDVTCHVIPQWFLGNGKRQAGGVMLYHAIFHFSSL